MYWPTGEYEPGVWGEGGRREGGGLDMVSEADNEKFLRLVCGKKCCGK